MTMTFRYDENKGVLYSSEYSLNSTWSDFKDFYIEGFIILLIILAMWHES